MTGWESVAPFLLLLVVFVSLGLYMLLDGFDLGVGTLALTETDDEHRHRMVESIVTVWDGNESWLVLAGAAFFAGFPLAFGTILPALYVPLVVMLLALVFRASRSNSRPSTKATTAAGACAFLWDHCSPLSHRASPSAHCSEESRCRAAPSRAARSTFSLRSASSWASS
jgi:hypothetical protein